LDANAGPAYNPREIFPARRREQDRLDLEGDLILGLRFRGSVQMRDAVMAHGAAAARPMEESREFAACPPGPDWTGAALG
jgi:hypothetical protein